MATVFPNIAVTTTSSSENLQYLRSNFITFETITINNQPVSVPDILNPNYLQVINSMTTGGSTTYLQGQQPTTIAFNATDTTSTWWMVQLYNGYINAYDMTPGDILLLPNVASAVNSQSNSPVSPPTPSTVVF
jgi:hypothetical protein